MARGETWHRLLVVDFNGNPPAKGPLHGMTREGNHQRRFDFPLNGKSDRHGHFGALNGRRINPYMVTTGGLGATAPSPKRTAPGELAVPQRDVTLAGSQGTHDIPGLR